ncbi:hypothetical protein SEVIR_2G039300v4 [Setaria viridis]|uniref:Uncharacterized protein n=1 Tax=Setaria viridis TaxID=4556 RepID=A0A4V6DAR9_SETVI|nr:F-box/kelch-repeat protein At1g30090 [Setaria viridis]XP_034581175.1 F-box/kelch-repeat protein At1g30090 [Setaria viridis]TKW30466.1 hypothetical protein SEVIR_2G039300v2 [Setaria viridis]TKW30467.1 hypothetical protein SEVIR_2G039300v2 [Setaria viridis]
MRRVRVSSHNAPVHKLGDAQMALTPKFRLATTNTPAPPPPPEDPQQPVWDTPLIPGLPDDAALTCLLRLPVAAHGACRLVCRRWHHLLADKARFFSQRRALGLRSPWLFTLAFHRCTGKIQWKVLDLGHLAWHAIPAMPCRDRACPRGFGCVAVPGDGALLVCGGLVSDMDCPLHLVLRYDVYRNRWTVVTRMLAARSFFAGGVIDGRVYVAGGYSTNQFELNSAEVLDPDKGVWQPIASMGINMASSDSAVISGRLYVTEGCAWPFFSSPRGQIYDPKINQWEAMPVGMREGWTGQSVVIDGRLFVISEYERMKVKIYDPETDSWDSVSGPPMPERIMKPFSVSCLDSRIVVVGRGLHVAIGHVDKQPAGGGNSRNRSSSYSVCWQDVDVPKEFSDLTPSSSQILHA